MQQLDLKTITGAIGLLVLLAGAAGGYATLNYRVAALEDAAETDNAEIVAAIGELTCFVAGLHDVPRPDCGPLPNRHEP